MAIFNYLSEGTTPDISAAFIEAHSEGVRTKTLLTALGDYWVDYYKDHTTLLSACNGAVALYSQEYAKLLDYVLSSNILDIPINFTVSFQLFVFQNTNLTAITNTGAVIEFEKIEARDIKNIEYYEISVPDVVDIEYLCSSVFEPEVVLKRGTHFTLNDGKIRFYVDIFEDLAISDFAYSTGSGKYKHIYLWATNIAFKDLSIYNKYGRYVYKKDYNSSNYKWIVTALINFYVNTKSVDRIESVINILHGYPVARFKDEKVLAIQAVNSEMKPTSSFDTTVFNRVVTNKNTYFVPRYAKLNVSVGDILEDFKLIGKLHIAEDYLSDPQWYKNKPVPKDIIVEGNLNFNHYELYHNILKYNIVYLKILITYETINEYKKYIEDIYEIISSGFPVYLYPFVDFVFAHDFVDLFSPVSDFKLGRRDTDGELLPGINIKTTDLFTKCINRSFDGTIPYYCEHVLDHGAKYAGIEIIGKGYVKSPKFNGITLYDNVYNHNEHDGPLRSKTYRLVDTTFFNGVSNYNHNDTTPDWHRPMPKDLPKFNAEYFYSRPIWMTDLSDICVVVHDCENEEFVIRETRI